jgi:hypothetical protein
MSSSGMLRRAALVRTDVSEERIGKIIRVARNGQLGTTLAVTSNRSTLRITVPSSRIFVTLMIEAIRSSETSVLTRPTRRSYPRRRHSSRPGVIYGWYVALFHAGICLSSGMKTQEEWWLCGSRLPVCYLWNTCSSAQLSPAQHRPPPH